MDNVKVRQKIRQSKLDPNLINICFQVGNQTRAKKLPEAGTRQNVNVIEGDIVFMLQSMKNKRQKPKEVLFRQATTGEYEYKQALQNTQDRQLIKIERSCKSNNSIGLQNKAITTAARYLRQGPGKQEASKS